MTKTKNEFLLTIVLMMLCLSCVSTRTFADGTVFLAEEPPADLIIGSGADIQEPYSGQRPNIVYADPNAESESYGYYNDGGDLSGGDGVTTIYDIPIPNEPVTGYTLGFEVGESIRSITDMPSNLAGIARRELYSEDSIESPFGSDNVKYNQWFYGRRIDNPYNNGAYEEQYNWNTVFICWCAEQLNYIGFNRMVKTADSGELYQELLERGHRLISKNDLFCGRGFQEVQESDLIFIPGREFGYDVGIVTSVSDSEITYIMGDIDGQVQQMSLRYDDYSDMISFIRIPAIQDYGLFVLTMFLCEELDLNTAAASGIIANMQYESTFEPLTVGDMGTSFGLCQWHDQRWDDLVEFCETMGYDWATSEGQLWFLKYELENTYFPVLERLRMCEDSAYGAYEAAYYFCYMYENPTGVEEKSVDRGNFAYNSVYEKVLNNY